MLALLGSFVNRVPCGGFDMAIGMNHILCIWSLVCTKLMINFEKNIFL